MPSMTSDLLRALADDLDADEDIGVVIITQENDDTDGSSAALSSNIDHGDIHSLLTAMAQCLNAPTYH